MRHPAHAKDRCCRVCHAIAVTAGGDTLDRLIAYGPEERADRRRSATQAAKVAALIRHWLPATAEADWRYNRNDRARTRTNAGLAQLYESTGERDG